MFWWDIWRTDRKMPAQMGFRPHGWKVGSHGTANCPHGLNFRRTDGKTGARNDLLPHGEGNCPHRPANRPHEAIFFRTEEFHTGCCVRQCSEPKQPVRGDIFVEIASQTFSSSVRSGIFHPSTRRCRSYGACDFYETKNYKYAAPTALCVRSCVHLSIIHTPQPARKIPATFPTKKPRGTTFSSNTNTAMMAIHQTFITPATNSSAMRNQQQPVQYGPCLRPMTRAPHLPSRQSVIRNPNGERQCLRQAFFSGVHWKIPATMSNTPPRSGLVLTIIGESSAAPCKIHCAIAASALKPVHTTR